MSFTSKKLHSQRSGMGYIKGATLFFLGMSCVLFMARAFDISPTATNAVQYIEKIFLTQSGDSLNTPNIFLDGSNGNGTFNGKVGIGITNPGAKLHVDGDIKGFNSLIISDNDNAHIFLETTGNSAVLKLNNEENLFSIENIIGDLVKIGNSSSDFPIAFLINNIERMRIAANGYIGIGLPNPGYPLQVSGTIFANTLSGNQICLGGVCKMAWPTGGTPTTPAGSTGNIQFNGGTGFSGASTLAWTGGALTVSGNIKLQNSGWINAGGQTMMLRLDGTNGRIGIGILNPSTELDINGTVTAKSYLYNSDKRLKTDISSISDPLSKILSLNGYMFTWKKTGAKDMGVIAQEVEKVFPEIVHTNNEGYKSVEYGNLVAPLIEAIKALNTKIDAQAKEIAALKIHQ